MITMFLLWTFLVPTIIIYHIMYDNPFLLLICPYV